MLINVKLLIEFWDKAIEARTYIQNRLLGGIELYIDNYTLLPEQAYSGKIEVDVNYIRVFSSKCYSYIDPKSLLKGARIDKLIPRGRVSVFMGYLDNITKQFKVYTPNLGYITRSTLVIWDKGVISRTVDLKIYRLNLQGTLCKLLDHNLMGRLKQ